MAIEIKQLLIKSTLVDEQDEQRQKELHTNPEALKDELLAECRRLMAEMLRDKGMR
ncbi:DUF5908 family protein [Cellvibrio japonicus]|uniref:Uncharacterized protein n=1 Tax=Cellvibrio japonicus (strain Ueda107) TaxID=498211 RepID=B3PHT1_CELJU|nr:DUF5908 family protein [Cellvibrio japonicus]ACE84266.1 hypothetical protein CJA_3673 [Cellvibrio japonicus Ueda107]